MRYEKEAKEIIKDVVKTSKNEDWTSPKDFLDLKERVAKKLAEIVDGECENCERIDPSDYVPERPYDPSELD